MKEKIKLGIPIEDEVTGETNVILRTNEIRIVAEAFEEIERLNNIINELEKDFERKIQSCTIEAETTTNDFYCRLHIATLTKWLNKIQELKGSESNDKQK